MPSSSPNLASLIRWRLQQLGDVTTATLRSLWSSPGRQASTSTLNKTLDALDNSQNCLPDASQCSGHSFSWPVAPGKLSALPPEIRYAIYDLAFPPRILRLTETDSGGNSHLLMHAPLALPTLAFACRETWYYARGRYQCIAYQPVNLFPQLDGQENRTAHSPFEKQTTWFYPETDTLYLDILADTGTFKSIATTGPQTMRLPSTDDSVGQGDDRNEYLGDSRGESAFFSDLVRSVLPLTSQARHIWIRPELKHSGPARTSPDPRDFLLFAGSSWFPRLETVRVVVNTVEIGIFQKGKGEEVEMEKLSNRQPEHVPPFVATNVHNFEVLSGALSTLEHRLDTEWSNITMGSVGTEWTARKNSVDEPKCPRQAMADEPAETQQSDNRMPEDRKLKEGEAGDMMQMLVQAPCEDVLRRSWAVAQEWIENKGAPDDDGIMEWGYFETWEPGPENPNVARKMEGAPRLESVVLVGI